jgi:hypothetical protein
MKSLKVMLNVQSSDRTVPIPSVLPLLLFDAEGTIVAEGATNELHSVDFPMPDDVDPVFVRLVWPSGKTQTKRVEFEGRSDANITFSTDPGPPADRSTIPHLERPRGPVVEALEIGGFAMG